MQKLSRMLSVLLLMLVLGMGTGWAGNTLASIEDVQEQIDAVSERLEQVRSLVEESRNDRAIDLLEQGVRNLDNAKRVLETSQDERQARNYVRRALELINAAVQEATRNRGVSQEEVQRELNRLREVLSNTDQIVTDSDTAPTNQASDQLMDRARQEAEAAYRLYEEGSYLQSMKRIRRAQELADQAAKSRNGPSPTTSEGDAEIIIELDQLISQVTDGMSDMSPSPSASQSLENATRLRNQAAANFERGRYDLGMKQALRAREILQWLLQQQGETVSNINPVERAARELERARTELELAKQMLPEDYSSNVIDGYIQQAEQLIAQSEQALANLTSAAQANTVMPTIQEAINLALKIQYLAQNVSSLPDQAQAAQDEYNRLVNDVLPDALDVVRRWPNANAVQYLEQAYAAAEKASEYLQQEDYQHTLQQVNQAMALARQAVNAATPGPMEE